MAVWSVLRGVAVSKPRYGGFEWRFQQSEIMAVSMAVSEGRDPKTATRNRLETKIEGFESSHGGFRSLLWRFGSPDSGFGD